MAVKKEGESKAKPEIKEPLMSELSAEHERFCFYLSRDFPQVRAYQKAYPNSTYDAAHVSAKRLLQKAPIAERVGILRAEREMALRIGEADIKADLAKLKNYNVQNYYHDDGTLKKIHEMDPDDTYAIESIEYESINVDGSPIGMTTKIKLANKVRPLELLGKTRKMFTDNVELSGSVLSEPMTPAEAMAHMRKMAENDTRES